MNPRLSLTALGLFLASAAWSSTVVEQLSSPSWFDRFSAVESLSKKAPGRADLDVFVMGLMAEANPAIRDVVVVSLPRWNLDRRTTFKAIAQALQDPDATVRRSAVDVAGGMGPQASALHPCLEPLLFDPSDDVRRYAALALAVIDYERPTIKPYTAFGYDLLN